MTGIETLILTLIHPSLYINTHTSISISYRYSYLNIKYIDLSLCGSSLPIHVIHPIPGPWLHANLAAQTNNYMRKRNRQLYSSSMESQPVLLDSRGYAHGETGCTMVKLNVSSKDACISKSQTVLVDSCWCTSFSNSIDISGYRGWSLSGHLHGHDLRSSISVNAARSSTLHHKWCWRYPDYCRLGSQSRRT